MIDFNDLNDLDKPEYEQLGAGEECPKCGEGVLIERYKRDLEGSEFLGCTFYPKCRFTQNL